MRGQLRAANRQPRRSVNGRLLRLVHCWLFRLRHGLPLNRVMVLTHPVHTPRVHLLICAAKQFSAIAAGGIKEPRLRSVVLFGSDQS